MLDTHERSETLAVQPAPGGADSPAEVGPEAPPALSLFRINFPELYARHLCRHSQYGINVIHLATVVGSYFGLFGAAYWLTESPTLMLALAAPYLVLLACNVPLRVFLACAAFVAAFFVGFFAVLEPPLPLWFLGLCPLLVIASHRIQNWSHKIYNRETDMTEFNKKYKKGRFLFVLLLIYELPILLNYLLFGRADWVR